MESVRLKASGVELQCRVAGQGPLVVLLHGFPECWYSWRHQIPVLAEHFQVVAPDLRGYGESEAPPDLEPYRLREVAADVPALVRALGHERAAVVGHDWGGVVSWAAAALYPDVVTRLAVLDAPHPDVFRRHLRRSWGQRLRSWYILFFQVPWLPETLIRTNPRLFLELAMRATAAVPGTFTGDDLDVFARCLRRPEGPLAYYRAAFRGLRRRQGGLPKVQCPTLVLWGDRDLALQTELAAMSAEAVDGPFDYEVLPRTGHWIQQERPDEVSRRLLAFLRGPGGGPDRASARDPES